MGGEWKWGAGMEGKEKTVSGSIDGVVQRVQDFESHTATFRSRLILCNSSFLLSSVKQV